MIYSHTTAPTQFIEANGVRYAYRRFGVANSTPIVLLQHFRGGLDNWDPLVTDGLARDRASFSLTTEALRARVANRPIPFRPWQSTSPNFSMRSVQIRLTCWAFHSAGSSPSRLLSKARI